MNLLLTLKAVNQRWDRHDSIQRYRIFASLYRASTPYQNVLQRPYQGNEHYVSSPQQLIPTSSVMTGDSTHICTRTGTQVRSSASVNNTIPSQSLSPDLAGHLGNTYASSVRSHRATSSFRGAAWLNPTGFQQTTGHDSGIDRSSVREEIGRTLYSRSVASQRFSLQPQRRQMMQCLRCGMKYPVTNLDDYEKHIRDCYSDVHGQS